MAEYSWPARESATTIGESHRRLDGLVKSTGAAKYSYDINLKNQLYAVALGCPHAHCGQFLVPRRPSLRSMRRAKWRLKTRDRKLSAVSRALP